MTDVPADRRDGSGRYEIRIKGHIADRWADWFDDFTLTRLNDGTTLLAGFVVDQAALHGVLQRIRDLTLSLISVARVEPEPHDERTQPR